MHRVGSAHLRIFLIGMQVLFGARLCAEGAGADGAGGGPVQLADIQRLYAAPRSSEKDGAGAKVPREEQRAILCGVLQRAQLQRGTTAATREDRQAYDDRMQLLQDLNIFALRSKNLELQSKSLFSLVKRTKTICGDLALSHMLANPTSDVQVIEERQRAAKAFLDPEISAECDRILESARAHEEGMVAAYIPPQKLQLDRINELFFKNKHWQGLNTNADVLLAAHIKDLVTIPVPFLTSAIKEFGQIVAQNLMMPEKDGPLEESLGAQLKLFPKYIARRIDPLAPIKAVAAFEKCRGLVKERYTLKESSENSSIGMNREDASRSWKVSEELLEAAESVDAGSSFLLSLMQAWGNFKQEMQKSTTSQYLQGQLIHVAEVVRTHDKLLALSRTNPELQKLVEGWRRTCAPQTSEFSRLTDMLRTATFQGEASFFSNTGRVRAAYKLFMDNKDQFADMMRLIGLFDTHRSIAHLYTEHQATLNTYSFVEAQAQATPLIEAGDFWNPFTSATTGVANTIRLAADGTAPRIAVVTGSNSGGKSTIMVNGLGSAVWLSQTLGIAPAKSMRLAPFDYIKSAIKVHDNPAEGTSHYVAETNVAAQAIRTTQHLLPSQKVLIVSDELMEGTNTETGHRSLRLFTESAIKCPQAIAIVVTQHKGLHGPVGLEQEYPDACRNFKVEVNIKPDGEIERLFKVENGVSTVEVGSRLLEAAYKRYGVVSA